MKQETAKVAARYWVDKFRNHKPYDEIINKLKDSGYNELVDTLKNNSIRDEQLRDNDFVCTELYNAFFGVFLLLNEVNIDIDYHPEWDEILVMVFDLVPEIELVMCTLPEKHGMIIKDDTILIREHHYDHYHSLD